MSNTFQTSILDSVSKSLGKYECTTFNEDLLTEPMLRALGDLICLHRSFSTSPFGKDKFEHGLHQVVQFYGGNAVLAPVGNPGADVTINGVPFSLKSEASATTSPIKVHISKIMELGKGVWGDNPEDLNGLRDTFLSHITSYAAILILRKINERYELVEISANILRMAENGLLEMRMNSKQFPKPGYCTIYQNDEMLFRLYFDGGGERKLQLKGLPISACKVHARWDFA